MLVLRHGAFELAGVQSLCLIPHIAQANKSPVKENSGSHILTIVQQSASLHWKTCNM